jgi:hypothetical protein
MQRKVRARQVVNAVNLSTALGLLVARLGGAQLARGPDGLVLGHGYRRRFPGAAAFTVGNVILTRHDAGYLLARPRLLHHESRHCDQWACWAGLPFLLGYAGAVGWSYLRTGTPALGNTFERRAGLVDGGYLPQPPG